MSDEDEYLHAAVLEKVNRWSAILRASVISVHPISVRDQASMLSTTHAVLVHNPFNVRQYQVLALLPPLDIEIAVAQGLKPFADDMADRVADDERFQDFLEDIMSRRLEMAADIDREFAHKLVDLSFESLSDLRAAGDLYQRHYGLQGGGDFNRPLYERSSEPDA